MAEKADLATRIESGDSKALTKDDKEYWPTMLKSMESQFADALAGTNVNPAHFKRVALTAIRANPLLGKADFVSLMSAIMATAQLGLEPHGPLGQAYLVPFNNNKEKRVDVTLIIGYQGLIELVYRSGRVTDIVAHAVYEKDEFEYRLGTNAHIDHKPAVGDRGEIVGAYAIANLAGGGQVFDFMHVDDIHRRRDRSRAKDSGPWKTDYEAMCRKTAVRQLFKWLPASIEVQSALSADGHSFKELPTSREDIDDVIDVEEVDEV